MAVTSGMDVKPATRSIVLGLIDERIASTAASRQLVVRTFGRQHAHVGMLTRQLEQLAAARAEVQTAHSRVA